MTDEQPLSAFPCGLRVFLRSTASDGSLHHLTFLLGRSVYREYKDDLFVVVHDADENPLAFFNSDAIAAIIPLTTEGPSSDAKN
jgi:hypothetical protein